MKKLPNGISNYEELVEDGYLYVDKTMYIKKGTDICLYLLSDYIGLGRIPTKLVDVNIANDYNKIGKMLDLCNSEKRVEILEKTIAGEEIISDITDKFNPAIEFTEKDMV